MIEKTTANKNYPKPDINNSLQDDVANIENALDMIDSDMHNLNQAVMPAGGIIMWSGAAADIPQGWALCDGNNNTPDLRDRFIVGGGNTYSPGTTGGADSVTLTTEQMPGHTHTAVQPAHNHNNGNFNRLLETRGDGKYTAQTYDTSVGEPDLLHSGAIQPATPAITVNNTGGDQPHENMPPYYALCFIMKL